MKCVLGGSEVGVRWVENRCAVGVKWVGSGCEVGVK